MNSAGQVTDAIASQAPKRWSIVVLFLLLVASIWYRAHTFAPDHCRGNGSEALASRDGRLRAA